MAQPESREGHAFRGDQQFPSENNSQRQAASGRIVDLNASIQSTFLKPSHLNLLERFGLSIEDLEELSHFPDNQLTPENIPSLLLAVQNRKMAPRAHTSPSRSAAKETLCSAGGRGPTVTKKVIDYGHKSKYEYNKGLDEGNACHSGAVTYESVESLQTPQAAPVPATLSSLMSSPKNMDTPRTRKWPASAQVDDYYAVTPRVFPHLGSLCNEHCKDKTDWIQHKNTNLHIENHHCLRLQHPDWRPEVSSSSKRQKSDREEWHTSVRRSASPSPKRSRCSSPGHARHRTRSRSRSSGRDREIQPRSQRHLLGHRSRSPQQSLVSSRQSQRSCNERRSGNSSRSPEGRYTRTSYSEKRHDKWKWTHNSSDCWEKRCEDLEQSMENGSWLKLSVDETGGQEQKCDMLVPEDRTHDDPERSTLASLTEKSVHQALALFQGGRLHQSRGCAQLAAGAMETSAVPSDLVSMIQVVATQVIEAVLDSKDMSSRRAGTSENDRNPQWTHDDPERSTLASLTEKSVHQALALFQGQGTPGGRLHQSRGCAQLAAGAMETSAVSSDLVSMIQLVATQVIEAVLDSKDMSSRRAGTSKSDRNPQHVRSATRKAESPIQGRPSIQQTTSTYSKARSKQPLKYNSASFKEQVRVCPTLLECRENAEEIIPFLEKPGESKIYWDNALLYREYIPKGNNSPSPEGRQMIVPRAFREQVMKIAHNMPLSGHLGYMRTLGNISSVFHWPGILKDVKKYVKDCEVCPKVRYPSEHAKEPLGNFPIIQTPFSEIQIDIQGPFTPTRSGERFVLVVIDRASCFPVAVPLRSITSTSVAKALLEFFAVYGFARVMISDCGMSFMRKLMQKLYEIAGVTQRLSTAYRPHSHVKKWGWILTRMLKALCEEHHRNWDEALPLFLSAYRETEHPSLGGLSPNEILFGKNGLKLPGVLQFLKSNWEGDAPQFLTQNFADLQQALRGVRQIAHEALAKVRKKQTFYFDTTAKPRTFQNEDQVLLLSPEAAGKLGLHWTGPFVVEACCGLGNYQIMDPARGSVVVHINRLKKFIVREAQQISVETWPEEDFDLPDLLSDVEQPDGIAPLPVNENLTECQYVELMSVLGDYAGVFSNRPGRTNQIVCDIDTGDAEPITCNPHPIQGPTRERVKEEIENMLQMGIIEPCTSEWTNNLVMFPKRRLNEADPLQYHLCVDFRKLNNLCKTNQDPSPDIEVVLERLARAHYITTFDLASGYWQVPLTERAKERTSFTCFMGQFCFSVLPFGVSSASRVFQRLMDKVLQGVDCAVVYQDDVAVLSSSWPEHLHHLSIVLQKIQSAGLTIKPSRCQIANSSVVYLGHQIGGGKISPHLAKIDAVVNLPTPETQKQLIRFVRACVLYIKLIPDYKNLTAPLSALCKKAAPARIQWSDECQRAFETLKQTLAQAPILKPPDYTQPFIVRTGVSPFGLGVVLMQKDLDTYVHPVIYLSRKYLPAERNYNFIERAALAVVWGLNQLKPYLKGTHFYLETGHNPLTFFRSMEYTNSRVLRWALSLQDLSFDVVLRCISSKGNALADSLSWFYSESD